MHLYYSLRAKKNQSVFRPKYDALVFWPTQATVMRIRKQESRLISNRAASLPRKCFPCGRGDMRYWHFAHTPTILTSSAPEASSQHPIYRSIFWLMRISAKPVIPYTTTPLSHFRLLHIPLDGFHAQRADGGDHMVVIFAVGTADQRGTAAGDSLDLVAAGLNIRHDL